MVNDGGLLIARGLVHKNEQYKLNLQKAVIASEDGRFLEHWGFDFEAMQKAYKNNSKGKRLKGGSTISQQTA